MQGGATFGLIQVQPHVQGKPPQSEDSPLLGCVGILLVPVVLIAIALGIVYGLRPSKRQVEAARQQQMQLAARAEAQRAYEEEQRRAAWYAEDMRRRQADAALEQRWAAEAEQRQAAEAAQQRQWAAEAERRRAVEADAAALRQIANAAAAAQREAEEAERRRAANVELERLWAAEAEKRRLRHEQLTTRFGAATADRILAGKIWQGQTREMLVEALGAPLDVDEIVLKTKTKVVYKYFHLGANRYSLRVTLESDAVVGWDDKR